MRLIKGYIVDLNILDLKVTRSTDIQWSMNKQNLITIFALFVSVGGVVGVVVVVVPVTVSARLLPIQDV